MNISFKRKELENILAEYDMLLESCQLCREDDRPRTDEETIVIIRNKVKSALIEENLNSWRKKNLKKFDRIMRIGK